MAQSGKAKGGKKLGRRWNGHERQNLTSLVFTWGVRIWKEVLKLNMSHENHLATFCNLGYGTKHAARDFFLIRMPCYLAVQVTNCILYVASTSSLWTSRLIRPWRRCTAQCVPMLPGQISESLGWWKVNDSFNCQTPVCLQH